MPKDFEKKVAKQGGAIRWRTKSLPGGKYLKIAVTRKEGKHGGRTVAHEKTKKSESIERIKELFALEEAGHKKGCTCGFCKNMGKIGEWRKGKKTKEVEESRDDTKTGKVNLGGSAAKAYHNMTSKEAMSPGWKPKAYQSAAAEVTNQKDREHSFANKGYGEETGGKALPKKRPGESLAQRLVRRMLDS